jgi:hypothetical protein
MAKMPDSISERQYSPQREIDQADIHIHVEVETVAADVRLRCLSCLSHADGKALTDVKLTV